MDMVYRSLSCFQNIHGSEVLDFKDVDLQYAVFAPIEAPEYMLTFRNMETIYYIIMSEKLNHSLHVHFYFDQTPSLIQRILKEQHYICFLLNAFPTRKSKALLCGYN